MNAEDLLIWERRDKNRPFNTEWWNSLADVMNGNKAARVLWRTTGGLWGLRWEPSSLLMQSHAEWELQLAGNVYDTGNRAVLKLGARAGAQATRDAIIWLANELDGAGWRFLNGILVGSTHPALDAADGTLINFEAVTLKTLIDASLATFVGEIIRLPGLSGRPGLDLDAISGAVGLRLLADFSHATHGSRLLLQTGEANGITNVGAIPNGTAQRAYWLAYNAADPAAASAQVYYGADADGGVIYVGSGTGSFLPFHLYTSNLLRFSALADGTVVVAVALRLANGAYLRGRDAANAADIDLIRVNPSDQVELGAAANLLSVLSPLVNNVPLNARNSTNTANLALIGAGSDNRVKLGTTGQTTDLLGTTVAADNNPPTADGEVTRGSQAKAYCHTDADGNLGDSYNVASVTHNDPGDFTVTWDRDFDGTGYAVLVTVQDNGANLIARVNGQATGSCDVHFRTTAGVLTDPDAFAVLAFGVLS